MKEKVWKIILLSSKGYLLEIIRFPLSPKWKQKYIAPPPPPPPLSVGYAYFIDIQMY